ncbi:MAG: FAD-dependent oxidoreductase [Pseudomonadota bacterium]
MAHDWDEACDVVVVGGGGAGLCAAIEAASIGRKVVLLEKEPMLGGSTAWSVGSISVTNSPHQRAAGIHDSPDAHFDDLEALSGKYQSRDNRALRRMLVDNITETFAWLEQTGLVFVGPNPEPPHRYPRMHNVVPNSRAFRDRLSARARRRGVAIRTNTEVTDLIRNDHCVTGVKVSHPHQGARSIKARGGVVLAGGDYSADPTLKAEYAGERAARLSPVNPAATGEGIRLGVTAGGQIVNGDIVRGPVLRFMPPPKRWTDRLPTHPIFTSIMKFAYDKAPAPLTRPFMMRFLTTALGLSSELLVGGAVLVNRHGARFCDECDNPNDATAQQPDGLAWVVFDHAIASRFERWPDFVSTAPGVAYAYLDDYRRTRKDIYYEAPTPTKLAERLQMPGAALDAAIAHSALTQPPFYALGPVKAYVVFTDGGLNVNANLEVLDTNGQAIAGLFAAGSNGQGGVMLEGHGHHLGWAFVSGRIAGRRAAYRVVSKPDG